MKSEWGVENDNGGTTTCVIWESTCTVLHERISLMALLTKYQMASSVK